MEESDKNTLIQQRIKKMLENKKRNQTRESGELTKRLKSNLGEKVTQGEDPDEEIIKPQSSMRLRRPASALKAGESTKTITTSSDKNDIDLYPLIQSVFDYGLKLRQKLKDHRLNADDQKQKLLKNELFMLGTLFKLKNIPEQNYTQIVELQIIARIQKSQALQNQQRRCQQAEDRISRIIEQRLKTLSRY